MKDQEEGRPEKRIRIRENENSYTPKSIDGTPVKYDYTPSSPATSTPMKRDNMKKDNSKKQEERDSSRDGREER